jgi:hypothetical protein
MSGIASGLILVCEGGAVQWGLSVIGYYSDAYASKSEVDSGTIVTVSTPMCC